MSPFLYLWQIVWDIWQPGDRSTVCTQFYHYSTTLVESSVSLANPTRSHVNREMRMFVCLFVCGVRCFSDCNMTHMHSPWLWRLGEQDDIQTIFWEKAAATTACWQIIRKVSLSEKVIACLHTLMGSTAVNGEGVPEKVCFSRSLQIWLDLLQWLKKCSPHRNSSWSSLSSVKK